MSHLLLVSTVIFVCILFNQISNKVGFPVLLAFIAIGMFYGIDGIFKIYYSDYALSETVCSIALVFIIFYGGFGTNWSQARPVAVPAVLLSTVGVILTAFFVAVFCHFGLHMDFLQSLLLGSVISSTDAASVFSVLRSRKMGLKFNTASLLELESGSNDPCSYMLTIIVLSLMKNKSVSFLNSALLVFLQFFSGISVGILVALCARKVLKKVQFSTSGFDKIFIIASALLSYSLSSKLGGNGYLSVYLTGIILGNTRLRDKKAVVYFFDGITGLLQMLIFFLLGLTAAPSRIPSVIPIAVPVVLFLTFVARPLSIFILMTPFRCGWRQQILVSFAGFRGASSIVFAIMALQSDTGRSMDIFHIVFFLVLVSIIFQGSLLPVAAKFLKMIDENVNVMKTFSDYSEENDLQFITIEVGASHPWLGKAVREMNLPPDTLIVLILRGDRHIVPHGNTVFAEGDKAVLSARSFNDDRHISLVEQPVMEGSQYDGKMISELKFEYGELIVAILRKGRSVIPKGNVRIEAGDILVINSPEGNEIA